jgi:membrane protease YdiL (CAAX protease family)
MMIPRSIALRHARLPVSWQALPRASVGVTWGAYLVAIVAAELLVNLWWLRAAMGLEVMIFAALVVQGSAGSLVERRFLVALSLAPLIRLVSLALPLGAVSPVAAWALVGVCLFPAVLVAIRVLELSRDELALRIGQPRLQLFIALLGFPIGTFSYYLLRPLPVVPELSWQAMLVPALILLLCGGFLEELIFRGMLQSTAWDVLGWRGVIYVAGLAAVLSLGFLSVPYTVLVFVVSLLFGWLVVRTGSLLGVSLAHGIASVMLLVVLPAAG